MLSPDKAFNPFKELKPTVAQLKSDYQTMMTGDIIRAKASKSSFFNDDKIAKGFQQREQDRAVQAARLIIEQVGRMSADELHRAVEPENLKDVLLRGGAKLETLLVLGEYEDADVESLAEKRQEQIEVVEASLEAIKNNNTRLALGMPLAKLKQADSKLVDDEKIFKAQRGVRTKVQVGPYSAKRRDYEERLGRIMCDIERAKEEAA
ncbi:MAG: hypothetical protein WC750_04800 [Patescibacteria group bacterium]|jgi:hypothetical protein